MELSFVLSALRRRFWIVLLFFLLGALPGLLVDPPAGNEYRSTALIMVREPTQADQFFGNSGDPDRYVLGQLAILESAALVNKVAVDNNMSVRDVSEAITVEQQPEVDIVEVGATLAGDAISTPEKVRQLAQSYVDAYWATLETERGDEIYLDSLDAEIQAKKNELDVTNKQIADQMGTYLELATRRTNPVNVPSINDVDPARASERDLLRSELTDLATRRNNQIANSRLRVNSHIIQDATQPTEPLPAGGQFLLAGGLFAGAMAGVVAAMAWARFSTKVLDEDTASEILGVPVVSEFPYYRSLARQPLAAFQSLPRSAIPIIDQLCVRAEAKAGLDDPLSVVVVGTQRGAGATTLALAMAERFASGGSSVVVVDADVRDPRITAIFNAAFDGGVPAVVANDGALIDNRGRSVFTRTMDPEVSVLGLGSNRGAASLRRDTVGSVLEAARRKAQIVVVDGGPALDLASTLQLTALSDAVVLALPLAKQKNDDLDDMARQLGHANDKLLPVITSPARRPAKGDIVGSDGRFATTDRPAPQIDLADRVPDAEREAMVFGAQAANAGSAAPPNGPV